jgi:23S rRNA G2445 N2-methylase RlmL
MTDLKVKIPDSLYKQIEALATKENMSIEQLVAIALSAQVSAWMTQDYLEEKAKRGSWDKFQQILNKVPDVEPDDYDKFD